MGDDTIYSGTVGAAMEGYLFGIPAIAFSQIEKGWAHLDAAARKARELVQHLIERERMHRRRAWLLNVNIPNLPLRGAQAVQGLPPRAPPCGREGDLADQPARRDHVLDRRRRAAPRTAPKAPTSTRPRRAMSPITPLKVDLTDHDALALLGARRGAPMRAARPRMTRRARLSGAARRRRPPQPPRAVARRPRRSSRMRAADPPAIGLDSQAVRARMVQKLAAQGIADARVLARHGRRGAASLRRQRAGEPGLRGHQPADRPGPDHLQAQRGGAHDRAAAGRAHASRRAGWAACSRSAPAAATRPPC